MKLLLDNLEEIKNNFAEKKIPAYRLDQLKKWVFIGARFSDMRNLPNDLLKELQENYTDEPLKVVETQQAKDGTTKFLFKLFDNEQIESVFLPNNYGNTLCVSTQVGCKMGCVFCASGEFGFSRNLTAGEIVAQYIEVEKYLRRSSCIENNMLVNSSALPKEKSLAEKKASSRLISNIVYMGCGEPLDNYVNLLKSISLFNDENSLNISTRNISISTCGLIPEILKLANEKLGVTLSVSLHATIDENRKKIMPIANIYTIAETLDALKLYANKTGRRVCIEYALIKNFNNKKGDAARLSRFLNGMLCHVNIIPLNISSTNLSKINKLGFRACSEFEEKEFLKELHTLGVSASIRRSLGKEILGACGQLRGKFVGQKK